MRNAGKRLHQLGTPGADQTIEAQNLAFAQRKTDMGKLGWVAQIFHLQHHVTLLAGDFRVGLRNGAADHHGHHTFFGDVINCTGTHIHTITQNGVVIR